MKTRVHVTVSDVSSTPLTLIQRTLDLDESDDTLTVSRTRDMVVELVANTVDHLTHDDGIGDDLSPTFVRVTKRATYNLVYHLTHCNPADYLSDSRAVIWGYEQDSDTRYEIRVHSTYLISEAEWDEIRASL